MALRHQGTGELTHPPVVRPDPPYRPPHVLLRDYGCDRRSESCSVGRRVNLTPAYDSVQNRPARSNSNSGSCSA